MNEKTRENKEYKNFQSSYIGKSDPFLPNWEDLRFKNYGKPLAEFTHSHLTPINGFIFDEKSVPSMGLVIYIHIVDQEPKEVKEEDEWDFSFKEEKREEKKIEEVSILDSTICLILYTQCQIDDVVLFFVWHFETQVVTESREAWEAKYGLVPGGCCLKNSSTIPSLESRQELGRSTEQEDLTDVANKKCQFQNQYVACYPTVFPHFVNPENPKAVEFLKNHPLNIPVNMGMTFGPLKDTPDFCYGGKKPGLCTSLYDAIIFDNTCGGKGEYNLIKFFSDAIATCFIYQNAIKPFDGEVETRQHSLLGFSLYY